MGYDLTLVVGLDDVEVRDGVFCKGCGLCVSDCPSGAIKMVPEEI